MMKNENDINQHQFGIQPYNEESFEDESINKSSPEMNFNRKSYPHQRDSSSPFRGNSTFKKT
jgi:hypothetical protein